MIIEKGPELGFCFGVRRAIKIVQELNRERCGAETLGALVHNKQVVQELANIGVRVARGVDDIRGDTVVTSAHGISPQVEAEIRARNIKIINTTCPFVRRLQRAARKLADWGFLVVIYGDRTHPEVMATLGWANNRSLAALDTGFVAQLDIIPHRVGILSQTTRIPAHFNKFVKDIVDATFTKDTELYVIDTICHDIRSRQAAALELAKRVDLMLVIGDRNSANTNRLTELGAATTRTYLVETAADIQASWFEGQSRIGITAGASTSEQTINEVITKLKTS
jgi:4-hydroxy-3-methylbut-2-enyl diphosphate reductase